MASESNTEVSSERLPSGHTDSDDTEFDSKVAVPIPESPTEDKTLKEEDTSGASRLRNGKEFEQRNITDSSTKTEQELLMEKTKEDLVSEIENLRAASLENCEKQKEQLKREVDNLKLMVPSMEDTIGGPGKDDGHLNIQAE
ncbi:uncharacterized protein [Ptychodera flava]|uniref:uncharacterized protein n=1 Tax=Ptychodera flava TaxID=63121 RepID=UPI00396A0435